MSASGDPPPTAASDNAPALPATPAEQVAAFETLLGVQVTVYDFGEFFRLDAKRLLPDHTSNHDRCGFCRYVKDDLGFMRNCLRGDMEPIVTRAQHPPRWRRCHAGVWEVVCPLWDGASLLGVLMVGCFRKSGENPTLPADPATKRNQPAAARLKQEHRAMRELDPQMETQLPALTAVFAAGLIRTVLRLQAGAVGAPSANAATTAAQDPRRLRNRAIDLFFRTHISQNAQLADLADHLHLSAARTSQILRRELHSTFPALIRKTRLQEACRLLTVSDLSIGTIAERAGFADRNYFCRVFTQELRLTPSEYRKQHARNLRA